MINFLLGMLVMYLIVGILAVLSDIFGNGFLDSWFFYLFAWWIAILVLLIDLILNKVKHLNKIKQNKKSKRA